MFRLVKRIFVSAIMFFGYNLSRVNPLECVSMKKQECKVRPEIINVNSKEPVFFPFSIKKVNAVVVVTIAICKVLCSRCF